MCLVENLDIVAQLHNLARKRRFGRRPSPGFRVATFNLGRDSEGVAAFARWGTGPLVRFGVGVDVTFAGSGAFEPGGSEDGGSEPTTGLTGVRKGDLNGLCSVLVASSSRRRFASGVDIFMTTSLCYYLHRARSGFMPYVLRFATLVY